MHDFIFPSFHFGRKALRRKGYSRKESGKNAGIILSTLGGCSDLCGTVSGWIGLL